jgi:phage FluMu protein Com
MQIRCYRCGWSFAIKKEEAAFALEALEETGGTHYDSSCPRCRHSNRISLEQLGKAAPRSADERQVSEQVATGEGMEPEAADENVEDSSGDTEPEE